MSTLRERKDEGRHRSGLFYVWDKEDPSYRLNRTLDPSTRLCLNISDPQGNTTNLSAGPCGYICCNHSQACRSFLAPASGQQPLPMQLLLTPTDSLAVTNTVH